MPCITVKFGWRWQLRGNNIFQKFLAEWLIFQSCLSASSYRLAFLYEDQLQNVQAQDAERFRCIINSVSFAV